MNILDDSGNGLVSLDYSDLLTKILTVLQNQQSQNPFSIVNDTNRLLIDIDEIAFQVASLQIENPLGGSSSSAKSASINFSKASRDSFNNLVQQIRNQLKDALESAITQISPDITPKQYIADLSTSLSSFTGEIDNYLNFNYPFKQPYPGLQKQRLSIQKSKIASIPLLKFHKLTITVENTRFFTSELKSSLQNFINIEFASEIDSNREELSDILDDLASNSKSDFYHIQKLMDTEALGKLQKEAKIKYLEFLKENCGKNQNAIYLEDLIRRLRLIEEYINDPQKEDGHYEVNYAGRSFNYREMFSRADALDMLPIIPLVVGYLGETTDENQGKQQFIFGLKIKFDGKVQSQGGISVFEYYLNLLDSDNPEHKKELEDTFRSKFFIEKIFKIAFLYFFVFASKQPSSEENNLPDLEYDPIDSFEKKVLPIFQGSDDIKKQTVLKNIKRGLEKYKAHGKIKKLKDLLQTLLKKESFQPRTYPIHISVKQGILERDINTIRNRQTLFKPVLQTNLKQSLKYISVDNSSVDTTALCTLPASINISDIQYFSTEDSQSFSMEYDIRNIYTIPVLLVPQEENCQRISDNNFKQKTSDNKFKKQSFFKFTYNYQRLREQVFHNLDSPKAFIYRVTFSLLAYTCLKILLDYSPRKLFVPIVRLHLTDKQDTAPEEEFMKSLFVGISHLLNEDHRSNSQGFCIKSINKFKIRNGLSSLYSVLPKRFKLNDNLQSPQLEKLAIIVVSSRESDRVRGDDYKISNLLGEVVGIDRQLDGTIRLYKFKTFSDNYSSQNMYNDPTVLIDEVNNLYQKGYRHFLYIAKSPYTNTLNMTRSEDDDQLFFMSKPLINSLKGNRDDIKIYPVFFDQYYVVKLRDLKSSSLYIQDTSELTSLVEDPSKKAVVFFNLFNGITVPGNDQYYNGVISYATLLNIYKDILDDTDIYTGLIANSELKNDLLHYLTLWHFSQYEAAPRKDRNISLKLDPYQNLIGNDSVGALSIFNHMTGKVNFNMVAFLTQVRKALNVQSDSK
ncbi:hypothetical protein H6G33_36000 [Calothrix sp. FACHB-1219]|uniref:hypothetical protein n=1 Tax=unclassified Calothrix TaxID=2619626 RepID=UPI0016874EDA|nr:MULTISPECIES: hypothetical protein [unclassified Calothrix]MBD2207763.1 hypothetical protein [Calothrix sp. FACHB-168]MBD2222338.1 hypothetical protein [Calothrix sp. FACHB-1219]